MTCGIHVSRHACERYVERVDPRLTLAEAEVIIRTHAPAVRVAAAFGCKVVRTGSGAKLLLEGLSVVTVLNRRQIRLQLPEGA